MTPVVAAADDRAVNAEASADARRAGVLVSVVDDPRESDFIVPAVVRRGELLLAISTGGRSPALAGHHAAMDRIDALIAGSATSSPTTLQAPGTAAETPSPAEQPDSLPSDTPTPAPPRSDTRHSAPSFPPGSVQTIETSEGR